LFITDKEDSCYLAIDLLSVHLIRNTEGNTLISYHPADREATSASYLHERIRFAGESCPSEIKFIDSFKYIFIGQSVYWQSIFQKSSDPTFLLLIFIWHAMYAWDEAMEKFYSYICYLVNDICSYSYDVNH